MHDEFLGVLRAAKDKLWKYVGNNMDVAKQARILDPRQIARLSPSISNFSSIFPTSIHDDIINTGEWRLYQDSIQPQSPKFDLLRWWESMAARLPIMYPYAPHPSYSPYFL